MSSYASRYEGIVVACYEEGRNRDWGCDPSRPNLPNIIVVNHKAAILGVTFNTRFWGTPWTARLTENPTLGAGQALLGNTTDSVDLASYWTKVEETIASVIGNATVDYLILLGTHARYPDLFEAIRNVINTRDDIDLSILDRYTTTTSSSMQDGEVTALFTGAREAAIEARVGMESGFVLCDEPEWCATRSEY